MSARNVLKHLMVSGSPTQRLEAAKALLQDRFRYVALACLWLLGAAVALLTMTGCAHMPTRTIPESHQSTVAIRASCTMDFDGVTVIKKWGIGSGVVVSPNQVLTAAHVVDEPACDYSVMYHDGTEIAMTIEQVWQARDVARLKTVFGQRLPGPFRPLGYGKVPEAGERVCVVTAIPSWGRRCGDVSWYRDEPPGDIEHTGIVEPGNSGSGVYDSAGRLVGITTHLMRCTNGQTCGGRFSSLRPEFLHGLST